MLILIESFPNSCVESANNTGRAKEKTKEKPLTSTEKLKLEHRKNSAKKI